MRWRAGGGALLGGAGEGLGDLEEGEAEFEEGGGEQGLLGGREVGLGFVVEDGEHVDGLTGAEDVDLGLLAFLGAAAELEDGLHVDGLDESLEGHGGGWSAPGLAARMAVSRRSAVASKAMRDCSICSGVGAGGMLASSAGSGAGRARRRVRGEGSGRRRVAPVRSASARDWLRASGLISVWLQGLGFGLGFAGVGVGAGFAFGGVAAAIGDDEGKRFVGHVGSIQVVENGRAVGVATPPGYWMPVDAARSRTSRRM